MTDTASNPIEMIQRMAVDPAFYRQQMRIEVSGDVFRYSDVAADWQESNFVAMDPAWLRCVGRSKAHVPRMRALWERCRGASKTADLGMMTGWGLKFAPRRIKINWYAGDEEQARLGIRAMESLDAHNPWLGLEVQRKTVRNPVTGSELEIHSSDAPTGYGQLVDAILVDEIANWPDTESAQKLWHVIASTLPKKQNCLCQIITNSGRIGSWQWPIREAIREDAGWHFDSLRVIPAWITPQQIAEQRRLLPANVFNRMCLNNWTSGTDSGIDPNDYDACEVLAGPMSGRSASYDAFVAACDLGWTHDRTGLVVLAVSFERQEIALACAVSWHPQDYGGELPLMEVEYQIEALHRIYRLDKLVFDPREATGLSQRLVEKGVPCYRVNLNPKTQNDMALLLLKSFNQRQAKLYPQAELKKDLLSLEVVDRTIGLKLEAARTSGGHSDLGFAYAIGNYVAHGVLNDYALHIHAGDEILYA